MSKNIPIAVVIPEHQTILAQASLLLASTYDVSKYAIKGATTINYPQLAGRTAQSLAVSASGTSSDLNYSNDVLNLDKKLFDAWPINLALERQNILNSLEDGVRESLLAIARGADDAIYDALIAACQYAGRNVVPTSDIYADIVDLAKVLDDAKVPASDRFLAVKTSDYAKLLKCKDFVRFDALGKENITSGVIGEILGFSVIKTTVVDGDSVAYHRAGISTAFQGEPLLQSSEAPLDTAKQYSVWTLFGVHVNQTTQSGAATPFAVRLGANP